MSEGKLGRWLNRVKDEGNASEKGPSDSNQHAPPSGNKLEAPLAGNKLDRWLSRTENGPKEPSSASQQPSLPASQQPSPPQEESKGSSKVDRWLARAQAKPDNHCAADAHGRGKASGSHANGASPSSTVNGSVQSGVNACCNLLHLLDKDELSQVHGVLMEVMEKKGVSAQAPFAAPQVPTDASEASSVLASVMKELAALANEGQGLVARVKGARSSSVNGHSAPNVSTEGATATGQATAGEGTGSSKLDRWLDRKKATPQPPPAPQPAAPASKLDRWASRVAQKEPASASASTSSTPPPTAGEGSTPTHAAARYCEAVRNSWLVLEKMVAKGTGSGSVDEERRKLAEEKKALDNLMQMVYAVKNTPPQVTGFTPPSTPPVQQANGMWNGPPNGAYGQMPPQMPPHMQQQNHPQPPMMSQQQMYYQQQMMQQHRMQQSSTADPDKLLAEFLKARREEREQETKQLVNHKKNPPKEVQGKGWRAGSPMEKAAKPLEKVHIGLTRPQQPQQHPQIMLMGPPPEGIPHGMSAQDVMNKEGGGFFFYPPGHPGGPGGGPPMAHGANVHMEGQLRSTVHPQERIAPHWSEAKFKAHGMPEVICEARHATFGPLTMVTARLVRCNPPQANKDIVNVDQVVGNIVYIKRGGCSFTKKARMAQAAGAVAMVVANSDRETFGMSFTDDGLPLDDIRIPCVMISSDVCDKLESCKSSPDGRAPWLCTLTPMVDRHSSVMHQHMQMQQMAGGGPIPEGMPFMVNMPPEMRNGPPPPGHGPGGKQSNANNGGFMTRIKSMLP